MVEVQDVWGMLFPNVPQLAQELARTLEPGSLVGSSRSRFRGSQGAAPAPSTRHYTMESQRLQGALADMPNGKVMLV